MNQVAQNFINSGTTNEAEGWVQGFDPTILTNTQVQMQASLEQHITDNLPNPTVGDVIGGRRTIIKDYPTLPASMQLKVLLKASDFAEMQDIMRLKYRLAFEKDILGNIVNPLELNFAKLNNHKLTLSFKPATATDEQALAALIPENAQSIEDLPTSIPAYLIRVIPQVALDEVVVKSGSPMFLGYDLTLYYQIQFTTGQVMNKEYSIPAGSYVNLMFGAGSVSEEKINSLDQQVNSIRSTIIDQNNAQLSTISTDDILGNIYFSGGLAYFIQNNSFSKLLSKNLNSTFETPVLLGTFGFEAGVNYLFGVPISLNTGGNAANIYVTRQLSPNTIDNKINKNLNLNLGIITSTVEHLIADQLFESDEFTSEAVSSVKQINNALIQGQKLFDLNISNQHLLSQTNYHPDTLNEINNAIASGYHVMVHSSPINYLGWNGSSYVVYDPVTGNGSFKIAGGLNGEYQKMVDGAVMTSAVALGYVDGATSNLPERVLFSDKLKFLKKMAKNSRQLQWISFFAGFIDIILNPDLSIIDTIARLMILVSSFGIATWIGVLVAASPLGMLGGIFILVMSSIILTWLSSKIVEMLLTDSKLQKSVRIKNG